MKYLLSILLFVACFSQANLPSSDFRVAFGSCAQDRVEQTVWTDMRPLKPNLFLFIGDNQYADTQKDENGKYHSRSVTDPAVFRKAYKRLAKQPHFAKFRKEVPIYAIWDDHDYGSNDGGKEYAYKKQSQKAFINFFNFEDDHPIHNQKGIYQSYMHKVGDLDLQIIMLDTRFHRDAIDKNPKGRPKNRGPYLATNDKSRSLLGEQQWDWLEKQLIKPADIRLLVSSIQVVAFEHAWESWGNMPHERQRLYKLINTTKANGLVVLSGDRHLMEISKDEGLFGYHVPYPIYDFTSSGLTQKYRPVNEKNSFRIGSPVRNTHFGVIDIIAGATPMESKIVFTALGEKNRQFAQQRVKLSELQITKQ